MIASLATISEGENFVVDDIPSKAVGTWLKVVREKYKAGAFSLYQLRDALELGNSYYRAKQIVGLIDGVPNEELVKKAYEFVSAPGLKRLERGRKVGSPFKPPSSINLAAVQVSQLGSASAESRRDELPIYKRGKGGVQIASWSGLAAGFGEELEKAPAVAVLDVLSGHKGLNAITIRGESMEPTLHAGDVILVETFNGGVELPPLDRDEPKNSLRKFKSFVQDDGIYVLQINGAGPTVKRVQFDVAESEVDWAMLVIPDNLRGYRARAIKRSDHVVVLARVIGLLEGVA